MLFDELKLIDVGVMFLVSVSNNSILITPLFGTFFKFVLVIVLEPSTFSNASRFFLLYGIDRFRRPQCRWWKILAIGTL